MQRSRALTTIALGVFCGMIAAAQVPPAAPAPVATSQAPGAPARVAAAAAAGRRSCRLRSSPTGA